MKYPIGIQSFDQLIEDGYVYVDKTDLVYKLTHEGKIYFLSRPRRFGKRRRNGRYIPFSMWTSTEATLPIRENWNRR